MNSKFSVISIISLIIALLGVIAPIVWDYYTDKKGISLSVLSRSVIISPSTDVKGLDISYKGTKLSFLSKTVFQIENIGNRPLLSSDIVSPIRIELQKGTNILDLIIEYKHPQNIDVSLSRNNEIIEVTFSLLNPGDKISFSLLTNVKQIDFIATARIAGVSDLVVTEQLSKGDSMWDLLWIPVGCLSMLLASVSTVGFYRYPQEIRVKRALRNKSFIIPDLLDLDNARRWVENTFYFTTSDEREPIISCLYKLNDQGHGFDKKIINGVVSEVVRKSTSNLYVALFLFFVGVFGIYYSGSSLGYF